MYKVGDKVIISKYTIPYKGEILYVKGYSITQEFYVVRVENGLSEHFKEEDLILDN